MNKSCQNHAPLCRCTDWQKESEEKRLAHFSQNFVFQRMKLEYESLDQASAIRLCKIGRCRECGGRLCVGTTLHSGLPLDERLLVIALLAIQSMKDAQTDSGSIIEGLAAMFHKDDRVIVSAWLSRAENQMLLQMYQNKESEE